MKREKLCSKVQIFISKILTVLGFKKKALVRLDKCVGLNKKLVEEVGNLAVQLEEMKKDAVREREQLRDSILHLAKRLEHENVKSMQDELTQVYNCRFLEEMTINIMANIKRSEKSWGILFIDFDNFKKLNDTHGHHMGDTVLVEGARLFRNESRDGDYIIRKGGDEFIFIMLNVEFKEDVLKLAERLRMKTEEEFIVKYAVTLSIGICFVRGDEKEITLKDAIVYADEAMYKSKDKGGNIVS